MDFTSPMTFTSPEFIVFVAAAFLLYYIAPRRVRWLVLLLVSYIFYMVGGWRSIFYVLFTTGITYTAGLIIGRLADAQYKRAKLLKKLTVAGAVILGFGVLFMLRYWNFVVEIFTNSDRFTLNLLIPLGLSFFTFQSVGYVIDVYRGKYPPERNPAKYALFVSFFPQIVQGPIGRFHQLAPQLTAGDALNLTNVKYGIQLAMWGYFKKLVIADRAAVAVNHVFAQHGVYGGSVMAFAVILYSIQLYCDFSGGIDMARGIAKMFGIDLAENFRRPIFATSLADFWRRWHITLGAWMKDYLFFALALSKPIIKLGKFTRRRFTGTLGKVIPTSICTFVVYFAIGIWHGANFRFVAFGLWNGAIITASLLMAGTFTKIRTRLGISDDNRFWWLFSILRTSFIVFLGRYITRSPRFTYALSNLMRTFLDFQPQALIDGTLLNLGVSAFDFGVMAVAALAMLVLEYQQEKGVKIRQSLEKRGFFVQWLAIIIPLAAILF